MKIILPICETCRKVFDIDDDHYGIYCRDGYDSFKCEVCWNDAYGIAIYNTREEIPLSLWKYYA